MDGMTQKQTALGNQAWKYTNAVAHANNDEPQDKGFHMYLTVCF